MIKCKIFIIYIYIYKSIDFILNFILDSPYYVGKVNEQCTFPNKIEDSNECRAAVNQLKNLINNKIAHHEANTKISFRGSVSVNNYPSGCVLYWSGLGKVPPSDSTYRERHRHVYWNNFPSNDTNLSQLRYTETRPICKRKGKYNDGMF